MSHSIKTTRSELVSLLELAYGPNQIVDLQQLNEAFVEKESEVRLELYLPSLLTSTYVLHNSDSVNQEVVLHLDTYDVEVFSRVLVEYLNEGEITELLDATQVVLLSKIPEVLSEFITNGVASDPAKYHPDNIRLAIQVLSEDELDHSGNLPELPKLFDSYNCTKIRLVIPA